jgi:hypothetical protein
MVKVKEEFKLDMKANVVGISLQESIEVPYGDIQRVFGAPEEGDGYAISGEWRFSDDHGNVFTLYDWKATNLYYSDYPTIMEFRTNDEPQEFHIVGNDPAPAKRFKDWLMVKINEGKPLFKPAKEFNGMTKAEAKVALSAGRDVINRMNEEIDSLMQKKAKYELAMQNIASTFSIPFSIWGD